MDDASRMWLQFVFSGTNVVGGVHCVYSGFEELALDKMWLGYMDLTVFRLFDVTVNISGRLT